MFDYRVIFTCEYEIGGGDCGEPATHQVWWDTFGKPMKVCPEHFEYIKKCEEVENA